MNNLSVGQKSTLFERVNDDLSPMYTLSNLLQRTPQNMSVFSGKVQYNHYFKRWGSLSVGMDSYSTTSD